MMMSELSCNYYTEPAKSDYSDSVEGSFHVDATTTEDTFGLEFAVTQWLKLVTNAENLFNKLVTSKFLTNDERNQIERWLCLKQECEECVGSEETTSFRGCSNRILERIDELTESDLKTEKSSDLDKPSSGSSTDSDTDTENDWDQNPDFIEKLDRYMARFKNVTDDKVENKKSCWYPFSRKCNLNEGKGKKERRQLPHSSFSTHTQDEEYPLSRRRKSILPGTGIDPPQESVNQIDLTSPQICRDMAHKSSDPHSNIHSEKGTGDKSIIISESNLPTFMSSTQQIKTLFEPFEELKLLSAGNEAKQSKMCQVLIALEGAQKTIEELQRTIQLKEQFIENMIKNDKVRATAKQRFTRKRIKLESEYYKTRSQLAQAEDSLMIAHEHNLKEDKEKCEKDIQKYTCEAIAYEKRLKNIEVIKQITENSARKMLELENSLQRSRCQMDQLKKKLKREEEQKNMLEQEILQDQYKIKELEEIFTGQCPKGNENSQRNEEELRLRMIQEEEERVLNMRESSQRFQEQLIKKQKILERREAFLKQRLCLEKNKTKDISEVSARISHLNHLLKEKAAEAEKMEHTDDKEVLRHEIGDLRQTRNHLVDQRCNLDEKFQKEKGLSNLEERKLIECDEFIEAIDIAIELKNELICGRKGQELQNAEIPREKGEELLLARLMKLSPMELRSLFYKYFQKVIDLRENSKKIEIQLTELEIQKENQEWTIQALTYALQQEHLRAESQMVIIQKDHEKKMASMLQYFAEESSGSSGPEAGQANRERRIAGIKLPNLSSARRGHLKPDWEELSGPPATKVTKEKNRLIIQQQKSKKAPKR